MNINSYSKKFKHQSKNWLILGKGESFNLLNNFNITGYKIATLNDAIRYTDKAFFSHFIDFEAFLRNVKYINKAKYLLMPKYPHFKNKKSKTHIDDFLIQNLNRDQISGVKSKLITYELNDDNIKAIYFSSEALFCILCYLGVKNIKFLGLDYGKKYARKFVSLKKQTLLANGRENFNQQFLELNRIAKKYSSNFHPLWLDAPITIFIGCSDSEVLAAKVLEFSIRKNNFLDTKIIFLNKYHNLLNNFNSLPGGTKFSMQRFLIPYLMNFNGKALYLDSDMLVFSDLTKLFSFFNQTDKPIITSKLPSDSEKETSVMLLDCSKLKWSFDYINNHISQSRNLAELNKKIFARNVSRIIPKTWNSLDYHNKNTDLLHFTDMSKQPWLSVYNIYSYIWFENLFESLNSKFIKKSFLSSEIKKGHIRPSIQYQLDNKIMDPIFIPDKILFSDLNFKVPYIKSVDNYFFKLRLNLGFYKRNIIFLFLLFFGPFFRFIKSKKYWIKRNFFIFFRE